MDPIRERTAWFRGDRFFCLQPGGGARPWRMLLIGPPGVGKGAQATLLAHALGACPLSTGELFRHRLERGPHLGLDDLEAQLNRGALLPDDYMLDLLRNRRACLRCPAGFLLAGFPRTLVQAIALDALLAAEHVRIDAVVRYDPDAAVPEALDAVTHHYANQGLLIPVSATGAAAAVHARTLSELAGHGFCVPGAGGSFNDRPAVAETASVTRPQSAERSG